MIKRLVMDLDNTLIMWKEEYQFWIEASLKDLHISYTQDMIENIKKAINVYEVICSSFERTGMVDYINQHLNINLPYAFLDIGLEYLKQAAPKKLDDELLEVLAYLKEKYDMVILTNWFVSSQKGRLETARIDGYFSHVYGVDGLPLKPSSIPFEQVLKGYKPEECLMIGDGIINDGEGASKVGMQVLIYDSKNQYHRCPYRKFTNFKELRQIL